MRAMATLYAKRALQLAVPVLLGFHGGGPQELAAAAGISTASLANYLSGRFAPPLPTLRRIARAAGVNAERLERLLDALDELCAEPAPGERRRTSRRLGEARTAAAAELLASRPASPGATDSRPLDERWNSLLKLPLAAARAVIEETPAFQDPALCERFCVESEKIAPGDPAWAVLLAEIAVCIADQVAMDGPAWYQLEARALSSRAHARRAGGDRAAAEADFQEANRFGSFTARACASAVALS